MWPPTYARPPMGRWSLERTRARSVPLPRPARARRKPNVHRMIGSAEHRFSHRCDSRPRAILEGSRISWTLPPRRRGSHVSDASRSRRADRGVRHPVHGTRRTRRDPADLPCPTLTPSLPTNSGVCNLTHYAASSAGALGASRCGPVGRGPARRYVSVCGRSAVARTWAARRGDRRLGAAQNRRYRRLRRTIGRARR